MPLDTGLIQTVDVIRTPCKRAPVRSPLCEHADPIVRERQFLAAGQTVPLSVRRG